MATRPSWNGHLRISLVAFPVQVFAGSLSPRRISFHQIHEPTGERVHQQPVLASGRKIDKADIVKGYEYEKGRYVLLSPEEIKEVRLPTKDTIEISEFVDAAEIDLVYYDAPYYVVPREEKGSTGLEAYIVFRDALRQSGKAALGEVVFAGKEHLVAIRPYGRGLLMETLRYVDELKKADAFFDDIKETKPNREQLTLAASLIKKKTGRFKPEKYEDSYESALQDLVARKLKKLPLSAVEEEDAGASNVISLMDALKRSIEGKPAPKAKKPAKRKPAARSKAKPRKRA